MTDGQDEPHIYRLDLTGPERRLGGAVRALGQIAETFCKGARRSLPFLTRQRSRLLAGEVTLGSASGNSGVSEGLGYKVLLESAEANAWATVRLDTGAVAAILDGSLGAGPATGDVELADIFGKELTVAQRALVGNVAIAVGEDFSTAVRSIAHLELQLLLAEGVRSGELVELPKDAICVNCAFEGSAFPANISLIIGAESLESAIQEQETTEATTGDPKMSRAVRSVGVQVIAELGWVELELGRVLSLHPGETLRLPTAVGEPIVLRVAGMEKFDVTPVVSRGQLAVQVKDRRRSES